jgi:hypothetical protein
VEFPSAGITGDNVLEVIGECHLREKCAITDYHYHVIICLFIQSGQFDLQRRENSSEIVGKIVGGGGEKNGMNFGGD